MSERFRQVAVRFTSDVLAIRRQVDFQKLKSRYFLNELSSHNETLNGLGLPPLPENPDRSHGLEFIELARLRSRIEELRPQIEKRLDDIVEELVAVAEEASYSSYLDCDDEFAPGELAEWVAENHYERLTKLSPNELKSILRENSNFEFSRFADSSDYVLERAIIASKMAYWNNQYSRVSDLLERFIEIELISDTGRASAPIGVLRQCFIAMMAGFDAAISDLVKIALEENFFNFAHAFERKFSVDQFADMKSWEELRDAFIEAQLKRRYVKDLIEILENNWRLLEDAEDFGIDLKKVRELIARRNVHVHNKGEVDKKYVNDFNIYALNIGDLALITHEYWEQGSTMCESLVRFIARKLELQNVAS